MCLDRDAEDTTIGDLQACDPGEVPGAKSCFNPEFAARMDDYLLGVARKRREVMRLTDGEGLDLAVDLAEVNSALDQAVSCLGRCGRAVIIGMCLEPIELTEPSVLLGAMNHEVLGHDGYEPRDLTGLGVA